MTRTLRYAFRSAIAWTVLAEVIRRHGESRNLHLLETHPGGGQYDCLTLLGLEAGCDDVYGGGCQTGSANLNICSGRLRVFHRFVSADDADAAKGSGSAFDVVSAYLEAEDPADVIDRICRLLGLSPQPERPGPTTRRILTVRLLAKMRTRYAFERRGLRYRMGYHDSSGYGSGILPDLRLFEWALRDDLTDKRGCRISEEGRAALCWLLYSEGSSTVDDSGPVAVIRMDGLMASAVSLSAPVDLYRHFTAGKRRIWETERLFQEIVESAFS